MALALELGEDHEWEHDLVVVGVVPARLRDRADLVAMAAMLGANPYQVAARLDHWRFGPTVALIVAKVPVEQFRQHYVFLTPEEQEALRELVRLGAVVTAQDVPAARAVPLEELLASREVA